MEDATASKGVIQNPPVVVGCNKNTEGEKNDDQLKKKKVGSRTSKEVLPEKVPLSAPFGLPECFHHV